MAFEHFRQALGMDQGYADFDFNMAIVYEKRGLVNTAKTHREAYLKVDPHSEWAELVRAHLGCE